LSEKKEPRGLLLSWLMSSSAWKQPCDLTSTLVNVTTRQNPILTTPIEFPGPTPLVIITSLFFFFFFFIRLRGQHQAARIFYFMFCLVLILSPSVASPWRLVQNLQRFFFCLCFGFWFVFCFSCLLCFIKKPGICLVEAR
jgi:hypothetical protein